MFILTIVTPAACFDSLFVCCGRRWADEHQQLFVASIGPGYDDSRIRPWVSQVGMDIGQGVALMLPHALKYHCCAALGSSDPAALPKSVHGCTA